MGFGFGDTVVIGFPDHPTLADIAVRDAEIAEWEAMDRGGHRLAGQLCLGSAALAVITGTIATLIPLPARAILAVLPPVPVVGI